MLLLLERAVFRPLIHRSGLNARVVIGGSITVGDVITPCTPEQLDDDVRAQNERVGLVAPSDG